MMDLKRTIGLESGSNINYSNDDKFIQYINLKLAALGAPIYKAEKHQDFIDIAHDLIANHIEKNRLLSDYLCPADQRIQNFLDNYLSNLKLKEPIRIPTNIFVLDRHGLARVLSLPPDKQEFISDIVSSYRIKQGILHNPKNDRRTTKGVFHIAEDGLPIPDDKIAVPKNVFAKILWNALNPPKDLLRLPFTSSQQEQAELFVSLLLRPIVSPEVKGFAQERSMEIRFFVPGNLVGNLDFVESIFGNAGDPYLPENDAALDVEHWTGHTGCIILAPHIVNFTKKELGLPNFDKATERQKRDRMCWMEEDELYNDGDAFKITIRTAEGIIVTIIADNYFGYCKKEIKTQISYSANLFGNVEEEHAGGAIAFPSYNLGDEFYDDNQIRKDDHNFKQMARIFRDVMEIHEEGYAVDKNYPNIIYVPENAKFNLNTQSITWQKDEKNISIKLLPLHTYFLPAGYKIRLEKNTSAPSWRLVGTVAEGTFCHKPSTVSGGGKSEISKSISDSILIGPYFVADPKKDFDLIDEIFNKDYSYRYKIRHDPKLSSRPVLSSKRSLGSVIKMLTPSPTEFTEEYNEWLNTIPQYVKGLVFIIKRFYHEEWEGNWRDHFTVDIVNGTPGNELKYNNRKLVANYLRVGLQQNKSWRTFKLRQDFVAADKIQFEDDITASIVVPINILVNPNTDYENLSVKIVENCEYRFFQRPDEAINRGFDKQAELDISTPGTFISNFEPLTKDDGKNIIEDAMGFDKFTTPMKKFIIEAIADKHSTYFVSSAHARMIDGKPSVNMRYLQNRPDLVNPRNKYIAEMGMRLFRKSPLSKPLNIIVNAVLPGRRNNPPDYSSNLRALCVYNPIHYQELPEMFMDFICSLTGKSPSTTGAGSEGALTKGPFNALCPIHDLNNALVSFILTGYDCYTTAAGYIGPHYRIDHDISLLIPEIWCRLNVQDRNPEFLIKGRYLEKLNDFNYKGKTILASRLGYRITEKFVHTFFGKVFENPHSVFNEEMLKPELQDMDIFVDGITNIVDAQKRVAQQYFNDGSIESACPPLKTLLHIMVKGNYKGKDVNDPAIREMFIRKHLIVSDWYIDRLITKQLDDVALWQKHLAYLRDFLSQQNNKAIAEEMEIEKKIEKVEDQLQKAKSPSYLKSLIGMIGTDPIYINKKKK
jgi:phosphoenolpyruvate carboxykinase (diphosphate)